MKLYLIMNGSKIIGNHVYMNKEVARKNIYDDSQCIEDIEVNSEFVGKNIYYLYLYKGFDYNYESLINPIYDVGCRYGIFYATKSDAKLYDKWKEVKDLADKSPDKYIVTDDFIASIDYCKEPFIYGDVMQGKINLKIKKLRVCKK